MIKRYTLVVLVVFGGKNEKKRDYIQHPLITCDEGTASGESMVSRESLLSGEDNSSGGAV
jgi:hypothetical protein